MGKDTQGDRNNKCDNPEPGDCPWGRCAQRRNRAREPTLRSLTARHVRDGVTRRSPSRICHAVNVSPSGRSEKDEVGSSAAPAILRRPDLSFGECLSIARQRQRLRSLAGDRAVLYYRSAPEEQVARPAPRASTTRPAPNVEVSMRNAWLAIGMTALTAAASHTRHRSRRASRKSDARLPRRPANK